MVVSRSGINITMNKQKLQQQIDEWVVRYRSQEMDGKVASYIPQLKKANPNHLGIVLIGNNGLTLRSGDVNIPFTIQSISKVFSLIVACMQRGIEQVLNYVNVEPTGEDFDSIMHLEMNRPKKPFNPFMNAGAITVTSLLTGETADEKLIPLIHLLEKMLGYRPTVNQEVYESERDSLVRNRTIGHYLLEVEFLDSDVKVTLETYFKQCSIEITVDDLAKMGQILAHDGIDPYSQKEIIPMSIARMAKALMVTCIMPQEILLHMLDFQLKAVCREGLLLLYLRVFKMKRSHFCKDVGLVFMVQPSIKKGIA